MKKVIFASAALFLTAATFFQCKNNSDDPLADLTPKLAAGVENYANITAPDGRSANGTIGLSGTVGFAPGNVNITNDGARLGRVLFYDPRLSINHTVSCASCHFQEHAFADAGKEGSIGMSGAVTDRNSPGINNVAFKHNLFWDSRVKSLPEMVAQPVANHVEMGMEGTEQVAKRLKNVDFYPDLFEKAFGDKSITASRVESALSQFLASMVSSNSKYDEGAKTNFANFSASELHGKDIFFKQENRCNTCHTAPLFASPDAPFVGYYGDDKRGAANIGLDVNYADNGFRNGEFCIPSLRNIALTAPYMHDGRFKTLEEVVEHYNSGIKQHPFLDFNLTTNNQAGGTPKKLNFTAEDKADLVAFLLTLTDKSLVTDPKFSDPFKN
jgi:cytochrome c peroxidase